MAKAHVALQRRLADCYAGRVVSDPREALYYRKVLGFDGGPWRETANYQAMLVASWAWRVALAQVAEEERRLAFEAVRKLYALEAEQGMFRNECLCPDPHAGMHLEAHLAILCLGVERSIPELREPALDWLGRALRLYNTLASPDGEPWSPGLRTKTKLPHNQAAAALLREVSTLPHRRPNGRLVAGEELATPGTTRGPYQFAALRWLLRLLQHAPELRAELRNRATTGPYPTLLLSLRVTRFDDGLFAELSQPAEPPRNGWLDPVDWLLVRWGKAGRHQAEVGRAWRQPTPVLPAGARVLERLAIPEE